MTAPPHEKEQALRAAFTAFESSLATWLSDDAPVDAFTTRVVDEDAPLRDARQFDAASLRMFQRAPDLILIGHGAGSAPTHWNRNQSAEFRVIMFRDAVHYDAAAYDTMFVRATTLEAKTLNGLFLALYETPLQRGMIRVAFGQPDPQPKRGMFESKGRHVKRLRSWAENEAARAQKPIRDTMQSGEAMQVQRAELAFQIDELLRNNAQVKAAQMLIWGSPDPEPTAWFVRR